MTETSKSDKNLCLRNMHTATILVSVLFLSLLFRIVLLLHCDAMYSWDTFFRVYHSDEILVSYWLPLTQIEIMLIYALKVPVILSQVIYAVIASLGITTTTFLVLLYSNEKTAIASGTILGFLPVHGFLSIVPYQEPLFLLLLSSSMVMYKLNEISDRDKYSWWGGILLAFACTCRFEAWIFAVLFAAFLFFSEKREVLPTLIPSAVTIAVLLIAASIVSAPVDPAAFQFQFPESEKPCISILAEDLPGMILTVFKSVGRQLLWIGPILALWTVFLYRNRLDLLLRTLIFFTAVTFILAIARTANIEKMNPRMAIFVVICAVPSAVSGLKTALGFLPASTKSKTLLLFAAVFFTALVFSGKSINMVEKASGKFTEDAKAAKTLLNLPAEVPVLISPRFSPVEFGMGSIFANETSLNIHHKRWFHKENMDSGRSVLPEYFLYWSSKGYKLLQLTPREKRLFQLLSYNRFIKAVLSMRRKTSSQQ